MILQSFRNVGSAAVLIQTIKSTSLKLGMIRTPGVLAGGLLNLTSTSLCQATPSVERGTMVPFAVRIIYVSLKTERAMSPRDIEVTGGGRTSHGHIGTAVTEVRCSEYRLTSELSIGTRLDIPSVILVVVL